MVAVKFEFLLFTIQPTSLLLSLSSFSYSLPQPFPCYNSTARVCVRVDLWQGLPPNNVAKSGGPASHSSLKWLDLTRQIISFSFFPSNVGGESLTTIFYHRAATFKNQFHLLTFSFLLSPDAEWIAHSEQLCHSTQHPSLPPSHPSVSLHGVQRHHLGLCDRTHMAAGQWQCSISPQLWHRRPSGLQEHEPRRHPPGHRLGAVKVSSTDWWGRGGGGVGGDSEDIFFHSSFFYEGLGPQDPYLCRSVCDLLLLLLVLLVLFVLHTLRPKDMRGINSLSNFFFFKLQTCRTGVLKNWCMTSSTSVDTIPSSQILYRTLLQMSLGKKKKKKKKKK